MTDYTDRNPANWTTAASTTSADRDFSAQDFNERRKPPPPHAATHVSGRTNRHAAELHDTASA